MADRSTGAVLLDCDGTLLDTELLLSEVSFLLLAPYTPWTAAKESDFNDWKAEFIDNATGRSFQQLCDDVDSARKKVGLSKLAEAWAERSNIRAITAEVAQLVAAARTRLGLAPEPAAASLQAAKVDENKIVVKNASCCVGMREAVRALFDGNVPFCLASASPRYSLIASLTAAAMLDFFQPTEHRVHSGESDFDPPRHKPQPNVYLKAAASVNADPADCIAVEDSESGVGAAANAGIGLIIGFVGGGHISSHAREKTAKKLLAGGRSQNGRGADIVLSSGHGLPNLVCAWRSGRLLLPFVHPEPTAMPVWGEGIDVWLPESEAAARKRKLATTDLNSSERSML